MSPAPTSEYHANSKLAVVDDRELSDAQMTAEDRRLVRQLISLFEKGMSSEVLMHFCCGMEAAAKRKREAEQRP